MLLRIISIPALLLLVACGGGSGATGNSNGGTRGAPGTPYVPTEPAPEVTPNREPVAVPRADSAAPEGAEVTLDGTASSDADGVIRVYAWRQTGGVPVTLQDAGTPAASFTAPEVEGERVLSFVLTVTDDGGASAVGGVDILITGATYQLSGTLTVAPGSAVDSDVNDWQASRVSNDRAAEAQSLTAPAVLGGYVNLTGAGADGPSRTTGDVSDFYRVDLAAGQDVTLLVADPEAGDPDLYLWNDAGDQLVDASLDTAAVETLSISADGSYLLEVNAFDGATNYTLLAGHARLPGVQSGLTLSDDFIPGDVILEWSENQVDATAVSAADTASALGLHGTMPMAGRPVLGHVEPGSRLRTANAGAATLTLARRATAIADTVQQHKFDTLLAIKRLRRQSTLRYAQPNFRVQPWLVPGDPLYPLQWHYPMIGLPRAWDYTRGDPGVSVAVVDTGVLTQHPDLAGQLRPGYDFVSSLDNGADGDGLDADPGDPGDSEEERPSSFHGTHVAGTIAAVAGNGRGGTGVAPGVKILPVRSLGVKGGSSYDIMQGVRYAAGLPNDSGTVVAPADVINMSLGRTGRCWPAEQAAFDAVREAGVLVVAAAGNDGIDAADAFPANCNHVLAVGAVDGSGELTAYSNFGAHVDVTAPGGSSADADGDGYRDLVLSLGGDDGNGPVVPNYVFKQGTSMASPHVAGVAALMKSVNPTLTPSAVESLLEDGKLTNERGVIDAWKSVRTALDTELPEGPAVTLEVSPASLNFGAIYNHAWIHVRASDGGHVDQVTSSVEASWLAVSPVAGGEAGHYEVTVNRDGLDPGTHSSVITLASSGGVLEVPVAIQVTVASGPSDAGHLYLLLVDADSGAVVRQTALASDGGTYAFHFDDVDNGHYRLLAGSDRDNDLVICDAGETCGWFLPSDGSSVLELNADAAADLRVEHRVSIPAERPASGSGNARAAGAGEPDKRVRVDA